MILDLFVSISLYHTFSVHQIWEDGTNIKADAAKETKEIKRSAEGEKAEEKPESAVPRRRDAKKTENEDFVIPKSAVDDAKYFVSGVLSKIGLKYELNVKLDKCYNN